MQARPLSSRDPPTVRLTAPQSAAASLAGAAGLADTATAGLTRAPEEGRELVATTRGRTKVVVLCIAACPG